MPRARSARRVAFIISILLLASSVVLGVSSLAFSLTLSFSPETPDDIGVYGFPFGGFPFGRVASVRAASGCLSVSIGRPERYADQYKPWAEGHLRFHAEKLRLMPTMEDRVVWPGWAGVTSFRFHEMLGYASVPATSGLHISWCWPVALSATAAFFFKPRRRTKCGLCPACGYDLRASPDRCPECGKTNANALLTTDDTDGHR
jgi:hypothetical protein